LHNSIDLWIFSTFKLCSKILKDSEQISVFLCSKMKKYRIFTLDIFVPRTSFILFFCSSSSCSLVFNISLLFIVSELYKTELFVDSPPPAPPPPVVVVVANNCWFCARVDFPINGNLKLIFCLIAWESNTVLTSDFIAKTRSCQLHVKFRYSSVGNDICAFSKSPIFFSFVPF